MNYQSVRQRVLAAEKILTSETLSHDQFSALKPLLKGINPKLDTLLSAAEKELGALKKLHMGDMISLTAEALPEHTEEDKKRKRVILLLLSLWKDIKAETGRIQKELEEYNKSDHSHQAKAGTFSKIVSLAKGPLGLVTGIALVLVVAQTTAANIVIKNQGCDTFEPYLTQAVALPGISIPNQPIPNGGQVVARMPPLPIDVDGTSPGFIRLKILGFSMSFSLNSSRVDVLVNGQSIVGNRSTLRLNERKEHEVLLRCH